MQEVWRIPFTAIIVGLWILSIMIGLIHSITAGVCMGIGIWLTQGILMWLATGCMFPRVIISNWLSLWSVKILAWTIK